MIKCSECQWVHTSLTLTCFNCGAKMFAVGPAKTQKAKGLQVLAGHQAHTAWANAPVTVLPLKALIRASEEIPAAIKSMLPAFVRPCPPSPEHGFVESRVVEDMTTLEEVRQETLAANPYSEIMLTPVYKDVLANAIWTPHLITVGPGHDGATAGKNTISLPLAGTNPFKQVVLNDAKIGDNQSPYVEAIWDKHSPYVILTQLRAGPVLTNGVDPDFIPVEMAVEEVIKTNGEDLLEWAKKVKSLKGKTGVVVYHPGGALTDHYSVHCRENGVPIVISEEPVVGLVLEPKPMPPLDPQALIKGLAVGDAIDMGIEDDRKDWIHLALVALHNSAALRGPHSFYIGLGIAAIIKLGSAAMNGEARHAHQAWKGLTQKPDIYKHYGAKSISFHRARLTRVTQLLHYGFGDPDLQPVNKGCGLGGRRWALCGVALAPIFTSIKRLIKEPTEENASKLLLDYNVAVNQAHNGGWWLNKFTTVASYDEVPKGNIGFALGAAKVAWQARSVEPLVKMERFLKAVDLWPEVTSIKPLKWRRASLDVEPGGVVLNLKASTLPKPYPIKIPTSPAMLKALIDNAGKVDIKPWEVNLQLPDGGTISLFKEKQLEPTSRYEGNGKYHD